MLYYETVSPELLELLIKLQNNPVFSNLRLVGGTSLALQIGHRKSADIDLFGEVTADVYSLSKALDSLGKVTILNKTENIHIYSINGIKVDIVNYHYKWLCDSVRDDNLIMASVEDIAAMKLYHFNFKLAGIMPM